MSKKQERIDPSQARAIQEMVADIPVIRHPKFLFGGGSRVQSAPPGASTADGGAWHEWKRDPPKETGVYVWRGLDSAPVSVIVHRRPTVDAPGGQLNGTALGNPKHFYNGCAVSEWLGFWIGPLPDLPKRGE